MTVDRVNYLNIALIAIACAIAFILPFELFLFSYVVLGPLHYLTEINWLHQRKYFTNSPTDYKGILLIGGVLLFFYLLSLSVNWDWVKELVADGSTLEQVTAWSRSWVAYMIVMAFVASLSMVIFKERLAKVAFTFIVSGVLFLLASIRPSLMIFAILLPTVIHVSLFMGLFMLYGAVKENNLSGYLSVVAFIAAMLLCFIYMPSADAYQVPETLLNKYLSTDLKSMNEVLLRFWGEMDAEVETLLYSSKGIAIQRFIAFTYTYHYLNWFSKTQIINWHHISKQRSIWIALLWVCSVGVYLYDIVLGITVLFLLSMLHVFLELPLNIRSFIGIGQKLIGKKVV